MGFENLEQRRLLSATLHAGQYTILDSVQNPADNQAIVLMTAASSFGVRVVVNTANDAATGANRINSITIQDPHRWRADVVKVELVLSGPMNGPVIYAGSPGDRLHLRVITEGLRDRPGGGFGDALAGALSGSEYGSARFVADPDGASSTPADGASFTAGEGDIQGGVEMVRPSNGGTIYLRNYVGDVGSVVFQGGVDLSEELRNDRLSVTTIADVGRVDGVRVNGSTILATRNMTLTLQGAEDVGSVVISQQDTIRLAREGSLTVQSDNGVSLSDIVLGTVDLSGSGDVNIRTSGDGDIAGKVTIAAVNISGSTGASLAVGPSGSGRFLDAVEIGTGGGINVFGSNPRNSVTIGNTSTSYAGDVTLGPINIGSTALGADVTLWADVIAGALTVGHVTASNPGEDSSGDVTLSANATGDIRIGNVTLGDLGADLDSTDLDLVVTGPAASLQVGDISNRSGDVGDVAVFLGEVGDVMFGDVSIQNPGYSNLGGFQLIIAGTSGRIAMGNVTVGDTGDAEDVASFDVWLAEMADSLSTGDLQNRNLNSDIAFFLDGGGGSLTLGNITVANPGVAGEGNVTISVASAGDIQVGNIVVGDAGADDDSGRLSFDVDGPFSSFAVGDITNHSGNDEGDVAFTFKGNAGQVTIGNVNVQNAGNVNRGDVNIRFAGNTPDRIQIGNIDVADGGEADTGAFLLDIPGTSAGGVVLGDLSTHGTDAEGRITVNLAGNAGRVMLGNVTAADAGHANSGPIAVNFGGSASRVQVGDVTLGNPGDPDTASFTIAGAEDSIFGRVGVGKISTSGTGAARVRISADGVGSIEEVILDDIDISDSGSNSIQIGQANGAAAMSRLEELVLKGVSNSSSNPAANLVFQARDIGAVHIDGTWNISAAGGVTLAADAGPGGNRNGIIDQIGGANWDILFASGASGRIAVLAADGIGPVTINSVVYGDEGQESLFFDADSDRDNTYSY